MSLADESSDLKTLLSAATKVPVLNLGEIKAMGTPPIRYVELHLAPRFGGATRQDGSRETTLRRLTTRVIVKNYDDGPLIEQRVADTFGPNTVTVATRPVLVNYESGGGVFADDDGWWSSATDWIY